MSRLWILMMVLAVATFGVQAKDKEECHAPVNSPEFGKLKQLIGKWEGVQKSDAKKKTFAVNYKLTSGNSAILETMAPGTPHEMISVYTGDGADLTMTHYCMLGNQPRMKSEEGDDANQIKFEFDGGTGMKPKDPHMHALTITFIDKNHFSEEWVFFDNGKEKSVETFEYTRVK